MSNWMIIAKYKRPSVINIGKAKLENLQESEFKFIAWCGKAILKEKFTVSELREEADLTNEIIKSAKNTYGVV